jgi:hypothetical protein
MHYSSPMKACTSNSYRSPTIQLCSRREKLQSRAQIEKRKDKNGVIRSPNTHVSTLFLCKQTERNVRRMGRGEEQASKSPYPQESQRYAVFPARNTHPGRHLLELLLPHLVFQQTLRAAGAAGTSTAAASNPSSSLMFDSLSQLPTTTNTQNNTHMHTQIHRLLACFPLLRQRHRATTPTKCTNKKIKKLKIPKPPPPPPPGRKKN